jgi:lipid-A-disaccharide synthase
MGFGEVILHLPQILSNFRRCKKDILSWDPDVIIFIDFPGFNLRMADWAHRKSFTTFYYIAPQAWAWKKGRVKKMQRAIDHLFVILPFERNFFQENGMESVHYYGHPLLDVVDKNQKLPDRGEIQDIALLPGSRVQEIKKILPVLMKVAALRSHQSFKIATVKNIKREVYTNIINSSGAKNVTLFDEGVSKLLPQCQAAIVTSGTATLETALYHIPQLVVYISSFLSYQIAKRVIQVPFISLVNLILNKEAVPELIQSDCKPLVINQKLEALEQNTETRKQLSDDYRKLKSLLGEEGVAQRIAEKMTELLHSK